MDLIAVVALLWLLFLRLVLRTLASFFAREGRPAQRQGPRSLPVEDLVLDPPVCRTHVPLSRALVARVAGREEHFCSAACRDKALSAVARASSPGLSLTA